MDIFYKMFLYFFIYSVIGWAVETVYCRIKDGRWTNRGFLFGPYCPIYGIGALVVIYFLNIFSNSPIKVFFLGMILTSILEYITSFLLEKIFNAKWWDYSNMKFNINGRVCLRNSLGFAILGIILTYFMHPAISLVVEQMQIGLVQLISTALLVILGIDTCSTIATLINLKEKLSIFSDLAEKIKAQNPIQQKISDSELYKQLVELKNDFIFKRDIQIERIINAFPNLEFKNFKQQFNEFKSDFKKFQEMQKENAKVKKIKDKN